MTGRIVIWAMVGAIALPVIVLALYAGIALN
jgi:hypothetical protein